jgi:hypothetical protein
MACDAGQSCSKTGECSCTPDSCDGWCHGAACEPFDTIATDQSAFAASRGIAVSGADVYWTNPGAATVERRLAGKSAETILTNNQFIQQLVLGNQRLFVRSTTFLYVESIKLDGSDVRTDAQLAYSMRFRSGRLYYATSGGSQLGIFSQSEANADDAEQDFIVDFTDEPYVGDLAFNGAQPIYAANFTAGAGSYDIGKPLSPTGSGMSIFSRKAGRLEQLESDGAGNYYWLRTTTADGVSDLLMQSDGGSTETGITTNVNVTDFTLSLSEGGTTFVYYAYTDPVDDSSGIRLYDTSTGTTYEVVTGDRAGSLVIAQTYLYFFEANGARLVRTRLPEASLGLVH